jgi:Na+-driven multidrug efflux pump
LEFRQYSFGWLAKIWAVELQWRAFATVIRSAWVAILVPFLSCLVLMVALGVMDAQDSAVAEAFSLAKRFELYLIQLAVCLGSGTMVVISSSLAVTNYRRARETMRTALILLFLGGIPVMIWMFLRSEWFYQSLTSNASIIAFGRDYFVWGGISTLFTVGIIVLNFIFQAIGRPERALPFLTLAIVVVQGGGSWILHAGLIDYIGYLVLMSAGAVISFTLALVYLMNVDELNSSWLFIKKSRRA